MSENKDEKYRKLREEVNLLKEQLIKIADELEEEPEPEPQDEPIPIEIEDTPDQEKEETSENDWETEDDDWERPHYSQRRHRPDKYSFNPPFMDQLGEYIEDFVEDVMEGVSVGLEESLRLHNYGPNTGPRPRPRPKPRPWGRMSDEEASNTSDIKLNVMPTPSIEPWSLLLERASSGAFEDVWLRLESGCGSFLATHPARLLVSMKKQP